MDIVKKNWLSIALGVVALVAIGATFYPMQGWIEEENVKLKQRLAVGDSITRVKNTPRKLPNPDPYKQEVPDLGRFPNERLIAWGKELTTHVHRQAQNAVSKAIELNRDGGKYRPLWGWGQLNEDFGWNFRDDYYKQMIVVPFQAPGGAMGMVGGNGAPLAYSPATTGELMKKIQAITPPTAYDIQRATQERDAYWQAQIVIVGNQQVNAVEIAAKKAEDLATLSQRMCTEAANKGKVYIAADKVLSFHPRLRPEALLGGQPNVVDMWFAQVGLWIQQDVINTIHEINGGDNKGTVPSSVVKQLLQISVPPEYFGPNGPISAANVPMAGVGMYGGQTMFTPPPVPDGPMYIRSATGRVSQPMYDVVVFKIQMQMAATGVDLFIDKLTRGRLITVLNVESIAPVDLAKMRTLGYEYGDEPVVEVVLECEVVFLRDWTKPLMPEIIKRMLGVTQPPAQPGMMP